MKSYAFNKKKRHYLFTLTFDEEKFAMVIPICTGIHTLECRFVCYNSLRMEYYFLYSHAFTLQKCIYVEFVKHLHDLYTSIEDTAKYGLFKYRREDDWKIIIELITTLGTAVEVKSNQIKSPQNISLNVATPYYYIPSARSASISSSNFVPDILQGESASSGDHSITYGYIAENLQVLLCKKLLLSTNHLLIPTKSVNTTIIRFCDIRSEKQDVKFIDMGDRVVMLLLNAGSIDHEKKE